NLRLPSYLNFRMDQFVPHQENHTAPNQLVPNSSHSPLSQQSHHHHMLKIHSLGSVNVQLVAHRHHHLHIRKVNLVHVSAMPTWTQVMAYPYRHKLLYPLVTNAHLQLSSFLFHWPFISTPSSD